MTAESGHSLPPENPPAKGLLASLGGSLWELYRSKTFWRFILILCAVHLAIFFLLGLWVYFILFGLFMVLLRLAAVSAPVRRFMLTLTGWAGRSTPFKELDAPLWNLAIFLVPALFWLGIMALGFWLLFSDGFLAQNLIYILFFK
jgi:hypothetical protein